MGDKQRNEIQKPVKNTLLSGASHGFPFDTFQGSSLLIPVSPDSTLALNDSVGDAKQISKDLVKPEDLTQITEAIGVTTVQDSSNKEETRNSSQSSSQGYTGLFSSFFGGISQKKQEQNTGKVQPKNSDQSFSTISSTPRSSSPFVAIQSFSPALEVPPGGPEDSFTDKKPTGFTHSLDSPFSHVPQHPPSSPSSLHTQQPQNFDTFGMKNPKELSKDAPSDQSEIHTFFSDDKVSNLGFGSQSNLGFESFYSNSKTQPTEHVLFKAQSAMELSVPSSSAVNSSTNTAGFFNVSHSEDSLLQNSKLSLDSSNLGSTDFLQTIQPPPKVMPPSTPSGPPLSLVAPPTSSGLSSRNYRRDHHKRLAYAPVPGLTSKTAVSTSYLQPCENFPSTTPYFTTSLTSPSGPVRQPLSGSLSQPALSLSSISSNSNISISTSPTVSSLQSFFHAQSFTSTSCASQPNLQSFEALTNQTPFPAAFSSEQPTNPTATGLSSSTPKSTVGQASSVPAIPATLPPTSASTFMVSSSAIRPPIMSTRETANISKKESPPMMVPPSFNNLGNLGTSGIIYRPAYHHWFIKINVKDSKEIWQPFSMTDSLALEQAFNSDKLTSQTLVPTDGGRYDVNIVERIRTAVYWEEEPKTVRRCSWFYKSTTESRLHPYDENTAFNLEEEYKKCVTTNTWNKKVDLPAGDQVIIYGPNSMALFQNTTQTPEGWEAEPDYSQATQHRPKIIKRGVLDDFEIDDGESPNVDHLIFVVHGIGSVCDFKFRTIEEAVDGFRSKSLQLIKSHFQSSLEQGTVNRVEILPVSWHSNLHGDTTGVDKKLQTITLKSVPRLRHFANDTLLDILFYTSPVYCQNIVQQVGKEINTLFAKFKSRNPNFKGGVSLVGHSLGSLILFDMLCHQKPPSPRMENIKEEAKTSLVEHEVTTVVSTDKKQRSLSRNVSYVIGTAGTGQPFIEYPQLSFQPVAFFAMGSPIGMFVTVRGIDSLGINFCLPTCSRFFNIFHPFDPVAYRIEALINPELSEKRPVLIPHHKGRKRMHLELKETMARVGADLKQRLVDSFRSTWNTVYQLTMFGRADDGIEQEVDKVIEKQLERQRTESIGQCVNESFESECNAGRLNQGRRIDYVLQEAPLESFNEYVSALTSHVIYWDSEDTMLLILKEIYSCMGITPDSQQVSGIQDDGPPSPTSQNPHDISFPSTSFEPAPSYGFK